MSDIIDHHKTEAANLALQMYDIEQRRKKIKERMREVSVIIQTAEHFEAILAEKEQAIQQLQEQLAAAQGATP